MKWKKMGGVFLFIIGVICLCRPAYAKTEQPKTVSVRVSTMSAVDIDPVTNPATDNWLTREIARQVGKYNVSQLTQYDFNRITSISMSYSGITYIPREIGNLYNLTYLNLSHNEIQEIPEEMGRLWSLEELDLSYNQIAKLPEDIWNAYRLRTLNLSEQTITLPAKTVNRNEEIQVRNPIALTGEYIYPISREAISVSGSVIRVVSGQSAFVSEGGIVAVTGSSINEIAIMPYYISHNGTYSYSYYANNMVRWIASDMNKKSFNFDIVLEQNNMIQYFSGTVYQPLKGKTPSVIFPETTTKAAVTSDITGSSIRIPIIMESFQDYYALDMSISYDTSKLRFNGYEIKYGLKDCYFSSENGKLRFVIASKGRYNPLNTETGGIIYLNFSGQRAGTTDIQITTAKVADIEAEEQVAQSDLGKIRVSLIKDVNKDNVLNLVDLAVVGYYYGVTVDQTDQMKYDADVIEDGRIDDLDLDEIVRELIEDEQ